MVTLCVVARAPNTILCFTWSRKCCLRPRTAPSCACELAQMHNNAAGSEYATTESEHPASVQAVPAAGRSDWHSCTCTRGPRKDTVQPKLRPRNVDEGREVPRAAKIEGSGLQFGQRPVHVHRDRVVPHARDLPSKRTYHTVISDAAGECDAAAAPRTLASRASQSAGTDRQ
jgi:hypothetical protein